MGRADRWPGAQSQLRMAGWSGCCPAAAHQLVEMSLPYLRDALAMGLPLCAVSKWYHLRTIYCLRTLLPDAPPFWAISWEPVYADQMVMRESWPAIPDGRRRVLREAEEVPRRATEGSYPPAVRKDGAWL